MLCQSLRNVPCACAASRVFVYLAQPVGAALQESTVWRWARLGLCMRIFAVVVSGPTASGSHTKQVLSQSWPRRYSYLENDVQQSSYSAATFAASCVASCM